MLKNVLGNLCVGDQYFVDDTRGKKELYDAETYTFEEKCNFRGDMNKVLGPELILAVVAEQFNKCDDGTPRVGPMAYETLKQDFSHDFLQTIILFDLNKEVEQQGAEPVSVGVGVPKVKDNGTKKMVLPCVCTESEKIRHSEGETIVTFNIQVGSQVLKRDNARVTGVE